MLTKCSIRGKQVLCTIEWRSFHSSHYVGRIHLHDPAKPNNGFQFWTNQAPFDHANCCSVAIRFKTHAFLRDS